MVILIVIKLD
jgi:hypothetical protein